jgi:ABC-2 type transport system permease protein
MSSLAGTPRLVRLGVRRDRATLAAWILGLGALTVVSVSAVAGIYPTGVERYAAAAFMAGNRLSRAFDGPASGPELGAIAIVETYAVLAVLAGLMSSFVVVRLTRQDEETGRAELLGSAAVGRRARLAAALVVAAGANVALGVTIALTLLAQGLPADGSIIAGVALAAAGLSFAAVAAVAAQLAQTQRAANGLAGTVLGAAFLLRAVGDAAGTTAGDTKLVSAWPSWLSPIGWGQQVRPFSEDRWDVFGLFAVLVVVLVAIAFALGDRRDLGAGALGTRPGPPAAEGRLASPVRLAWRLQRASVAAWVVAVTLLATAFASLGDGADELIGISDELDAVFSDLVGEGELLDGYVAFVMGMVGVIVGAFAVQAMLRTRTEESTGRIEQVLAAAVGRRRWVLATAVVGMGATLGILGVVGVASALTFGLVTGDLGDGLRTFGSAAVAQVPAILALAGAVIALVGMVPRWAVGLAWAALAVSLVAGALGPMLDLPQAVMNLSPFTHVHPVPASGFTPLPMVALTGTGVLLAGVGIEVFRRRDLTL